MNKGPEAEIGKMRFRNKISLVTTKSSNRGQVRGIIDFTSVMSHFIKGATK